jgi:UV DNA damage endonuclease
MKIGYPCLNLILECSSSRTFRLVSYNEKRLIETVEENLDCLRKILRFNQANNLLFFRLTSGLVPFASHSVNTYPWQKHFSAQFQEIGDFIKENQMRISTHPGHFTLINSPDEDIFQRSVSDLEYHADILDLMNLGTDAKIQIHVGGVYKNKYESMQRFMRRFLKLPFKVMRRLVIENDEHSYTLADCLLISKSIGIPVVMDYFHHELNNTGEKLSDIFLLVRDTWQHKDGRPMIDYSSQDPAKRFGSHAETIDLNHFSTFLKALGDQEVDIMLEIKDKERSALKVVEFGYVSPDSRGDQRIAARKSVLV